MNRALVAVACLSAASIMAGCGLVAAPPADPHVTSVAATPVALRLRLSARPLRAIHVNTGPFTAQRQWVLATFTGIGLGRYHTNRWTPVREWWGTGYRLRRTGAHQVELLVRLSPVAKPKVAALENGRGVQVSFTSYATTPVLGGEIAAWRRGCAVGLPAGMATEGPKDAKLPPYYLTYRTVRRTVGRLLAQRSQVPVLLPTTPGFGTAIGTVRGLHVEYGAGRGYCLALGGGIPARANSLRGGVGDSGAGFLETVQGWPASIPLPAVAGPNGYMGYGKPPGTPAHVMISGGYQALRWGTSETPEDFRWQERGWTINASVNLLVAPGLGSIVKQLEETHLPAAHGIALFAVGAPDGPSAAAFVRHGVRYVVMANGFRALPVAAILAPVTAGRHKAPTTSGARRG